MKSPLLYLLEVLFCSGILLAFYRLLLVRKVAYVHCRRYLVAAVIVSAAIPALDIPVYPARTVVYPLPLIAAAPELPAAGFAAVEAFPAGTSAPARALAEAPAGRVIDWPHIARLAVTGLYVATVALLLVLFVLRIAAIRRLRRRSRLTDCASLRWPSMRGSKRLSRSCARFSSVATATRSAVGSSSATRRAMSATATPPSGSPSNSSGASFGSILLCGWQGAGCRRCRSGRPTATCSTRVTTSPNIEQSFFVNSSVIIRI